MEHIVIKTVARILTPFIILYAFYIQFHGEYSPGGGFQAGVIAASAFIAYALGYDLDFATKKLSLRFLTILAAIGVLLYASVGVATMLLGGYFLEYTVLLENQKSAQQLGIVVIELGVGITVFAVMMIIFYVFGLCSTEAAKGDV
jgi:multicomponent Na+:H+ antiporter subunit B